ncbi:MAG: cupin domain-containing protein [Acidobacteria bacterium]|nr:cupin domain-containing protein [Acidobacteriota bacterium]
MKRRSLLGAVGMGAVSMPMFPAAIDGPLPNITFNVEDAKRVPDPSGELLIYFDGPTGMCKRMTAGSLRLKPGASPHPPHEHPEEEFMVITEGTGEMFCDGKTVQVKPGAMMYCGARKLHGIVNTGKKPLTFYFYKWRT